MNPLDPDSHGPATLLSQGPLGNVSLCSCGVVTVTLQYLSLRFEPSAFRELQGLLEAARQQLDAAEAASATTALEALAPNDAPVH